jgi:hypothetical protein
MKKRSLLGDALKLKKHAFKVWPNTNVRQAKREMASNKPTKHDRLMK